MATVFSIYDVIKEYNVRFSGVQCTVYILQCTHTHTHTYIYIYIYLSHIAIFKPNIIEYHILNNIYRII